MFVRLSREIKKDPRITKATKHRSMAPGHKYRLDAIIQITKIIKTTGEEESEFVFAGESRAKVILIS